MSNPIAGWTWRGRLGLLAAAIWFLLTGLHLVGVAAPEVLMLVLALVAGILLLLGI